MITHIVMWQLKAEAEGKTKAENAVIIKNHLEGLKGLVPELRSIEAGINLPDAPAGNYDVCLRCTFDSMEDLAAYQTNEIHQKVAAYIVKVSSSRACVDY